MRRIKLDLIFLCKLSNNYIDSSKLLKTINFTINKRLLCNTDFFYPNSAIIFLMSNSPINCMLKLAKK